MSYKNYILSLDASTTCTGWALFYDGELVEYGKIKPDKKLDWRDRIKEIYNKLEWIVKSHPSDTINKIYIEDVPLKPQGGIKTSIQLGAVQGMIITLSANYNIDCEFIPVSEWRRNMSLFNHTVEGKKRDNLKIASIEKANELFNLKLNCIITKSGNYNGEKSDDDIADAILIGASKIPKYNSVFGIMTKG